MSGSAIQEFLQSKDKDFSKFIPQSYKISQEEKEQELYVLSQQTDYELAAAAKCIKPCFATFQSPAVSQSESDCMTNCTSKALEVLTQFKLASQRN